MREKNVWKGLLAGAISGLVATAAKTFAEKMNPPRIHGEPEPPEVLADKVAGHSLTGTQKVVTREAIHWGFGVAAGAAYGALVEFYPAAAAQEGASFGLALLALTHETALPAMGLSPEPEDQSLREQSSEAAAHVLFGVTAERVRKLVRARL